MIREWVDRLLAAPPPQLHHSAVECPLQPIRRGGWRERWACRKNLGHCWHPEALIYWWCCACGVEIEGMPAQDCRFCREG